MIHLQKDSVGKFRQKICINNKHELFADVAIESGGEDSASQPHDIFDASLAACKAMTLMLYAQRANIPLEKVDVDIERDDSKEKSGEYSLNVTLHLVGNLTLEQKQKLMTISEKCPVHKLMTQTTININTQLATNVNVIPRNPD